MKIIWIKIFIKWLLWYYHYKSINSRNSSMVEEYNHNILDQWKRRAFDILVCNKCCLLWGEDDQQHQVTSWPVNYFLSTDNVGSKQTPVSNYCFIIELSMLELYFGFGVPINFQSMCIFCQMDLIICAGFTISLLFVFHLN